MNFGCLKIFTKNQLLNDTIPQPAKGNLFKGPFHLPRQEWYCWKLLEENETLF